MEATLGQINAFGFNFAPRGWATCSGQLVAISSNTALFSLLGTMYGGDGRTTFAYPDLRGRASMNQGRHPGSAFDWRVGQTAGQEYHTLSILEMPNHSHNAAFTPGPMDTEANLKASTDVATQDAPTEGAYLAHNDGGRNPGVFMYRPDAGNGQVSLGGASGGSGIGGQVTLQSTGGSQSFQLLQPTLAVNYSIATIGIYPSRS